MSARPLRHIVEYALFRGFSGALSLAPEPFALGLGSAAGWLVGSVLRLRRREVDEHLRIAFPEESVAWRRSVALASYRHLGRQAAVVFRLRTADPDVIRGRVVVDGSEELRSALTDGKGAIVVTGHLGNWELGGVILAGFRAPVYAVAKRMANRRFDADLDRLRKRMGIVPVEPAAAPGVVLRALAQGCIAAFVADQDAHEGGVFVPFFGRPAATPRGAALLALRSGAPLFLGVAHCERWGAAHYRALLERVEVPRTGDLERDVTALTEAYTRALERAVRARPEQYLWQHRRWKTLPPAAPDQEQPSGGSV